MGFVALSFSALYYPDSQAVAVYVTMLHRDIVASSYLQLVTILS